MAAINVDYIAWIITVLGAINSNHTFIFYLNYLLWKLKTSKRQVVNEPVKNMAVGRSFKLSANFLSIYITFENYRFPHLLESTLLNDREIYFASQMNCRNEVAGISFHRNEPTRRQESSGRLKSVVLCKLFHRACFALALTALAGDIETNPGYQKFDDIKSTRGLKIAHLNIRSLANKTDSLRLQGITNKTFDVLTLSETWLD